VALGTSGAASAARIVAPTTMHRGHMPSEYLGLATTSTGLGVTWDELRGLYPDDVYRLIPLSAFGR
jgi:hypothetical protein